MAKTPEKSHDMTIYVLNGPNLNMLGTREPQTYGHARLADVEKLCRETAAQFGLTADCRQSNSEGQLIDLKVPFLAAREKVVGAFERRYLETLLRAHKWKVGEAAAAAGIDRVFLWRLLRRHGLRNPTK